MLSHQILLPPTGWAGDLGVLWGLKFGSHTSATSNKGHTVRPHAADNTSGSGKKTGKTFFFVFEIQDHHAVELTERSPMVHFSSSVLNVKTRIPTRAKFRDRFSPCAGERMSIRQIAALLRVPLSN